MKNWIRGELLELTHDTVFSSPLIDDHFQKSVLERLWSEHQQLRHNHSHLFWTLLNVSLWERLLLTGPRPNARSLPTVQICVASPNEPSVPSIGPPPVGASATAPAVA